MKNNHPLKALAILITAVMLCCIILGAFSEDAAVSHVKVIDGVVFVYSAEDDCWIEQTDSTISADVDIDLNSESLFIDSAVDIQSDSEDSELTVDGNVEISSLDQNSPSIFGVQEQASNGNDSYLEISGNLTAEETSNDSSAFATAASLNADGEDTSVTLVVGNDITANATSENSFVKATAVDATATDGAAISIDVGGKIISESDEATNSGNLSKAIDTSADGEGSKIDIQVENGVEGSVSIHVNDHAETTLNVADGGICSQNGEALALNNAGGTITVDVTGDISSEDAWRAVTVISSLAEVRSETELESADDIPEHNGYISQSSPTILMTDDGEMRVYRTYDFGIRYSDSESENYTYTMSSGVASDGELLGVYNDDNFTDPVEVNPDELNNVTLTYYEVVNDNDIPYVYAEYTGTDAGGNAYVICKSFAIDEVETFEGGTVLRGTPTRIPANTTMDIMGDISLNSDTLNSVTVDLGAVYDSELTFTLTGNISATAENATIPYEDMGDRSTQNTALMLRNQGGLIDAAIEGDISATGAGWNTGINIYSEGETFFHLDESAEPVSLNEEDITGIWNTKVDDKWCSVYITDDYYIKTADGLYQRVIYSYVYSEGTTTLTTTGNVKADQRGISLDVCKEQTADILIDGTLEGEEASVVLLNEDTIIGENVTLTVWEVKPDKDDRIVVNSTYNPDINDGVITQNKDAEKAIQYIIRINAGQMNIITAKGTREYNGYHVAKEGETVTLKLTIPNGYEITGAYGDVGQVFLLLQNEDGDYYLTVPRGGAVELSVTMKPKNETKAEKESKEVKEEKKEEKKQPVETVPGTGPSEQPAARNPVAANPGMGPNSVVISQEDRIFWLREENENTAAWYGFNNHEGALPNGSIISVNWLNKNKDDEFKSRLLQAESSLSDMGLVVEDDKIWIFDLNAISQSGELLNNKFARNKNLLVYVELADGWEAENLTALFLSESGLDSEKIAIKETVTKVINGVERRFAVLELNHFSCYAIAVTKEADAD